MASKKEGGGSKLARSQVVTIRLDPKLRYAAELAARKQRRTVSSFIEWCIEESLERVWLDENNNVTYAISLVWDVDEPDRFAKTAFHFPDLLTHDEQVLWKLVCENGSLWKGDYSRERTWTWSIDEKSLMFKKLREHFETFQKVAKRELDMDELPKWKESNEPDDIPF